MAGPAASSNTLVLSTKETQRIATWQRNSRLWMGFTLVLGDIVSLLIAGTLATLMRLAMGDVIMPLDFYLRITPLAVVFVGVYAWRGLYPAVGLSPVDELQRLTGATSVVFLLVTGFTFWLHTAEAFSRLIFAFTWVLALVFVPVGRSLVRQGMIRLGLWGEPVAVLGYGPHSLEIIQFLCSNLHFGLRPVVALNGREHSMPEDPIPVLPAEAADTEAVIRQVYGVQTAILVTQEVPESLQEAVARRQRFGFRRLILMPDLKWVGSVGIVPYDLQGLLGLEVRQNLLNPWQQWVKRSIDLLAVAVLALPLAPLMALIALAVHLDSPGGSFYTQTRIGRNGKPFKMLKFRTMHRCADQLLEDCLEKDPVLRAEWDTNQKLKKDPRITRVGRVLRNLSLDELPQLINILRGEMSLVGPRPFFPEQDVFYGSTYALYVRVRPGLTGMWQISGRNKTTFAERVQWDEYYVRQWSIWLDIYILWRTIDVVLSRKGAY